MLPNCTLVREAPPLRDISQGRDALSLTSAPSRSSPVRGKNDLASFSHPLHRKDTLMDQHERHCGY